MSEFKTLQELIEKMRHVYLKGLYSFYIFEGLSEVMAPNIVGQALAQENVKIMNKYDGFWGITREAHYSHCVIQFAKCFDQNAANLSISFLKRFSFENLEKLTSADFKEFNTDREFLDELVKGYKGLAREDIKRMKELQKKCQPSIDRLMTTRHHMCHAILDSKSEMFTVGDLKGVGDLIAEILNIFTYETNNSSTWYDRTSFVKDSAHKIISDLKKYEKHRLEMIKEKYSKKESEMFEGDVTPAENRKEV